MLAWKRTNNMGNSTIYYATILLVLCASQLISAQLSSTVGTDISISTVSVLLPHDHKVSYVIEAYNGCFKWSLSREGVVDIKELDTCGTKVQIRAASTVSQGRQNVWLLGEHLQSGRLLRCEIYVDHIVKIDILTTTRTMFKEDTEILQIQAFDLEGNLFSSLEGLEYEWSIRADTEATASSAVAQVLKMVRFRESSIEVSESLLRLEDEGKQSSIVLVQGLNTGRARVSSRLTKYANPFMTEPVPTAQVTIAVREPLLLAPSTTIWVLPGTQIQYTLMSYAKETLKPLDPSTAGLYLWTTSNNQVAEVSQQGLVTAKQVGATRVTAQYVDLEDNNAWSELVVVLPAYLALKITPQQLESSDNKTLSETHSSGSYLISGWEYVVQIEVYDKDGHKIYNIDDLDFNVQLSADYFQVLGKSKNSAQHHVTAVKEGPTEIVVTLEQIRNRYTATQYQPSPPLITRSDVIITAPVKLTAHDNTRVRHVNLAYHNHVAWLNYYNGKLDSIEPNITNVNVRRVRDVQGWGHEVTLTAVGGTGLYEWYSTDQSVVLVRPATHATASNAQLISNNLGRLVAESTGSVTVHASDSRNPINRDHVLVHVSTPHRIEFANSEFECQVDSTLTLSVQLYDQHNVPYDNCSALPFVWEVQDEHVFAPVASTGPVQHCSHRVLRALREGQTTVTVHYMNLRIEVTVFSFKPLRVVWPRDFALVTLGSSAIVLLEGGPNPWTYESSGHTTEALLPQQPNAVAIHKLKANTPYRAYSITCLELGDQDITVEVTNSGSAAHPRPLRVTSKFHFSCQLPQHIFLFPVLEHPNKIDRNDLPLACTEAVSMLPLANHEVTREMLGNFPTKFLTRNNQSIEFEVYLYDRSGRKFTNFTSLNMEWSVTESSGLMSIDLLAANRPRFPYLYTEGSQLIAQLIKDTHSYRHGRLFNLALKEGSVIARVRVVGYDSDTLAASKIQMPYWTASTTEKLTRDIELTLYRNVQAQPPRVSLFNHPHNTVPITALGGSGYFQLNVNDTTVANISYQFGSNVIHVTPLRPGHVKLTLVDLCLTGSEPSFSQIQISDIHAVQLRSRDMVKIGDQIPVLVDLLDMNGQPFDQSQYRFIDTQLLIDSDSIDIAPARAEDLAHMSHDYRTENTWLARGLKLGVARVTARASPRDEKVTNPRYVTGLKTIHVFPPLELHPRPQHVMVVGSQYHIALRGGPPVPSEIVFQVDNTTVALVDKTSGAVTALVEGRTRLRVHCSVWDQTVNRHVIISEDSIELIIGYIQDFKIHADSYVLKTGNEFTFRLTGVLTAYFDHRLHVFEVTPTAWTHLEWMRVKWSVVDPSVLQLLPIYHSANITLDEERSVTVRGRGVGAGRTMVSVRVENVTALIRPRSHVLEPIVASAWVHVSDPLKLLSPAHLFLAPQTSYQLHTNKNNDPKLKYKLLSCVTCGTQQPASAAQLTSELHVNARGVITTHNTVGTWLILITERDDAVNPSEGAENSGDDPSSSVLVRVSVRLISSIELVPLVLPPHFPFVYYDLPVGSSMLLQLQARDDLGHVLHAFSPQALHVDSQLSHPQLVALSQHFSSASLLDDASALNTTSDTDRATSRYIIVRGLRPGHALLELRGHSSLPTIAVTASQTSAVLKYHLQIRVSNAIAPLSPTVHVGGTIQFSTSFAQDKALYKNTWSSANEDVVRIDTNTGEAVAVSVGETVVYHNSSVFTWTHVKVVRVARVELESPITSAVQNDELTSDGSQYLMPVVPRDASGAVLEDSAAIKHHLLIKCALTSALQMQNVFVRNFTNPQTLQHYCIVKPFATKHDKISEPITVRAVVSDAAQTAAVSADKQFTLFTSFKILAPRELFLTRNANVQLEVQSKKELSVRNTNPELISIRRVGVDAATHTWTYELKAVDPTVSVRRLPIEFLDLDSGQAEHIFVTSRSSSGADVLVIDDKGRASSSSMAWWLAILIGTATVVLAYLWSMNNNTPAPAPRPVNRVANTPYLNSGSDAAFNPITSPTRSFSPSRGSSDYSHFITSPSQRK